MPESKSYYELLDVSPEANYAEIKRAYLDKSFILHPDRMSGAPESAAHRAEEELKRVNRAYDILKNPTTRQQYHQEWLNHQKMSRGRQNPPPPPSHQPQAPPPGNIVLGNFSIRPQWIQLGRNIRVSVIAINNGGTPASRTIAITGDFIGSDTITLNPGTRGIVKFTITPEAIGNFNVSIGRYTGSFRVTATPPSPAPPLSREQHKPQQRTPLSPSYTRQARRHVGRPVFMWIIIALLLVLVIVGFSSHFW
jgi:curved DNA-binding protein CbpA